MNKEQIIQKLEEEKDSVPTWSEKCAFNKAIELIKGLNNDEN